MLPRKLSRKLRSRATVFLGLVFVMLLTQPGQTQGPNSPTFFKNYFVTGDAIVVGMGLTSQASSNNFLQTTITVPPESMPGNAVPVAAFLYWATVVSNSDLDSAKRGAMFRGTDISAIAKTITPTGVASCWSNGGAAGGSDNGAKKMVWNRADVLKFFYDTNQDGLFDSSDSATAAIGGSPSSLILPHNGGNGNGGIPKAEGAGVVIIYKDPSDPLRAFVLYDGGFVLDQAHQTSSTKIEGYYQALKTADPQASLTTLIAEGQPGFSETFTVTGATGSQTVSNPFTSSNGTDPAWDTYVLPLDDATLGIKNSGAINVTIGHSRTPFDCVAGGAFLFKANVQDTDSDGLLDVWEAQESQPGAPTGGYPYPRIEPNGRALPNLAAMGASKTVKDVFIEMGATYEENSYNAGAGDVAAHNHLPNPYVLKATADPFIAQGIVPHFDVGPLSTYFSRPGYACPASDTACLNNSSPYLVGSNSTPGNVPRGGELIHEYLVQNGQPVLGTCFSETGCQFPNYPGTIGWKAGFQFFRDEFVSLTGEQKSSADESACEALPTSCRRRFDRGTSSVDPNDFDRKDMFHYGLYAHYVAVPQSGFPCLNGTTPVGYNGTGVCQSPYTDNPLFHTPRTISGKGDLPGGDYLETLGGWGNNFTGPEFVQASTTVHEVGHNFWLTHRGILFDETSNPKWQAFLPTLQQEKNCNPNYLSVMSYLFQVQGLRQLNGVPQINFSNAKISQNINEYSLPLGLGAGTLPYVMSWYAPVSTAAGKTVLDIAKKHCDGSPIVQSGDGADFNTQMVRISGTTLAATPVDWNGDLVANALDLPGPQDVSFNGRANDTNDASVDPAIVPGDARRFLIGNADWAFVKEKGLQQLGSRRRAGALSLDGSDIGGSDIGGSDIGGSDIGGSDIGGSDIGGSDIGGSDIGGSDIGGSDIGGSDIGGSDIGGADQDFQTATAYPVAAHSFAAVYSNPGGRTPQVTSSWKAPVSADKDNKTVGARIIVSYNLYKSAGTVLNATTFANKVLVATVLPPTTGDPSYVELKPKKGTWIYWVVVKYSDGSLSDNSNISNPYVVVP